MYFLNKVDIYPMHFIFTEKRVEMNGEGSAQKMHKKVHKEFFYWTDIYVCDNFVFLFHFLAIWLSVKFKDFFII